MTGWKVLLGPVSGCCPAMTFKIDDAQLNLEFLKTRFLLEKLPRGHSISRL